jgi:hypothetical protein
MQAFLGERDSQDYQNLDVAPVREQTLGNELCAAIPMISFPVHWM